MEAAIYQPLNLPHIPALNLPYDFLQNKKGPQIYRNSSPTFLRPALAL